MDEGNYTETQALIVDDEVDICFLLNYLLKKSDIRSEYVTSIRDAKEALRKDHPRVMLLDNHLSDGLGLDFIPYVKDHYPSVRIIMITAFDGHEEKEKAMALGAAAFISKPFTRDDILEVVHQLDG